MTDLPSVEAKAVVEVFYYDGGQNEAGEYFVWDCDNNCSMPGWYWWYCQPGCLPDSDPYGPYTTRQLAEEAAREG